MMVLCATPGHADKRVALVVGNDRYVNLSADQQLRNAMNDARAVGDVLRKLGFDVIRGENLGRQGLIDKFDELAQRLTAGDTAFFYFSGHGVALGGGNYIRPSDVPNVEADQETRLARAALGESTLHITFVQVLRVQWETLEFRPEPKPPSKIVVAIEK
jgi:uncharacterized caspase-like protein